VPSTKLVEVTVVAEVLKVATRGDRGAQARLVHFEIELIDQRGGRSRPIEDDVHRLQHRIEALLGALADFLVPVLERMTRAPTHAGQEHAVHLDKVIERGLLCFDEEAGDQHVPLGRREAAQLLHVVTFDELDHVLHHLGAEPSEIDLTEIERTQQVEAIEVCIDRRWRRFGWVLLELKQRRPTIFLRDQQLVDGDAEFGRQAVLDALPHRILAARRARSDQTIDGRPRGNLYHPRPQGGDG